VGSRSESCERHLAWGRPPCSSPGTSQRAQPRGLCLGKRRRRKEEGDLSIKTNCHCAHLSLDFSEDSTNEKKEKNEENKRSDIYWKNQKCGCSTIHRSCAFSNHALQKCQKKKIIEEVKYATYTKKLHLQSTGGYLDSQKKGRR